MIKRVSLLILTSIFLLSMTPKNLDPVKLLVYGNNNNYNVQLIINGVSIGNGSVSGLKILNKNHPLKSQFEDFPPIVKDQIAFVLKEGENTIKLKFKHKSNNSRKFSFALTAVDELVPLFYFSSEEESGSVTSKFYVWNTDETSELNTPSLGNADASFIFSESTALFQATLNDNKLMVFGGTGGLTDLNLIEGQNTLKVNYICSNEGEFTYYIHTPNFTKKVIKNITKDQVDSFLIDTYTFEK
ncbi:hypothetical protein [Formosa sp. L2A11]|uniref:hypothetical protein n=1 Tax=Formosa sp. L2A11 TaxID=2686363 RepID=UPI00131D8833|nr:hypothetical protein [Formosa sp. L2A11]